MSQMHSKIWLDRDGMDQAEKSFRQIVGELVVQRGQMENEITICKQNEYADSSESLFAPKSVSGKSSMYFV